MKEQCRFTSLLKASRDELKKTRTLIFLALLMALTIAVSAFRIRTPFFSITLGPIVKMYTAMLFGPVAGAAFGCAKDLLQFLIDNRGDPFFPGYTFTETLGMFVYGLFFYRKPLCLGRVLLAKLVVVVLCNILLGTLWMSLLYGKAFLFYLPPRIGKNLIQWPVDSLLFSVLAGVLGKAGLTRQIKAEESR